METHLRQGVLVHEGQVGELRRIQAGLEQQPLPLLYGHLRRRHSSWHPYKEGTVALAMAADEHSGLLSCWLLCQANFARNTRTSL